MRLQTKIVKNKRNRLKTLTDLCVTRTTGTKCKAITLFQGIRLVGTGKLGYTLYICCWWIHFMCIIDITSDIKLLYDYRLSILINFCQYFQNLELLYRLQHQKRTTFQQNMKLEKMEELLENGSTSYSNGIRKDTSYFCPNCPKQRSLCLEPCFKNFYPK